MRIRTLQLSDYRNFQRLSLELPAGPCLFVGDNAQAIYCGDARPFSVREPETASNGLFDESTRVRCT